MFQDEIQKLIDGYDSTLPIEDPCPHCQITKDILSVVRSWAIDKRAEYELKRNEQKMQKPKDINTIIILGAKIKAFQQMIDNCQWED